ncbi:MAG: succinate dehydrogenase iron-sulfur subunit [Acidobacteria bacterium]|nr:succinate dehydrogenase iron-sulfur subunit [Acidobacteriota bacterium]
MPESKHTVRQVNFHVTRYNPERDERPYVQTYALIVREGMTVLDGLHYIKDNLDASLAWRFSCRMGVCGSCGMLLNGRPTLACNTQILHIAQTDLTVGPLPNFSIVRDLVPDLMTMLEKHRSIRPYIVRADEAELNDPAGEFYQSPEELEAYLQFTYCIKCGCCMAACPTLATDVRYLGPMPLAAAQRYNLDTRDDGRRERNQQTGSRHGAFRCHFAGECSRACPKGVDPAKAIQHLKRRLVLDYLHLARRKQPCQKLDGPGHGTPLADIPAAPARTV